jgi:hypothetical protein
MSETKFTPGPWIVNNFREHYFVEVYAEKLRGHSNDRVALLNVDELGTYDGDEDYGRAEIEAEANAHLIAAAPDLYEAVMTVVKNMPEPYCAITRAIDAQCRAALAKARGEIND